MKITIVLGAFFPVPPIKGGAVEKAWFALGQQFALRGHEVVMISREIPEFHREEILESVKHIRIRGYDTPRSLVWLKILDLIYSIRAMPRIPKTDIVVTNTFWLPILLRIVNRGKIYVHVARYPKGQMRFYGNAARLQSPSRAVARAVVAEAPWLKNKVAVIPYPAPTPTIAGEPASIGERENIILFVGRVHPEKGVHLLVEAFAGLSREIAADWRLSIVGPAEEELGGGGEFYLADLKRAALNSAGTVFFHGPVFNPTHLEQHFRNARLFVYPSLAEQGESFGLAPLEAMAHGCAVMVSNLDCFGDFVRDCQTGFVFDHRSESPAQTLRQSLEAVIVDPTLLTRVAAAGYKTSSDYSVNRVADQFLHDFSSLVSQSHA
jgi:glycosyltransferase involved in cell wall biosynthesis